MSRENTPSGRPQEAPKVGAEGAKKVAQAIGHERGPMQFRIGEQRAQKAKPTTMRVGK